MSEQLLSSESFQPGQVISIPSYTGLPAFEDEVAQFVRPGFNEDKWQSREPLLEFLRSSKAQGTLKDFTVQAMDEPFERLLDANARGWAVTSIAHGKPTKFGRGVSSDEQAGAGLIGFTLQASRTVSGKGIQGTLLSELWYGPRPTRVGDALFRVVARPRYDTPPTRYPRVDRHAGHMALLVLPRKHIPEELPPTADYY